MRASKLIMKSHLWLNSIKQYLLELEISSFWQIKVASAIVIEISELNSIS